MSNVSATIPKAAGCPISHSASHNSNTDCPGTTREQQKSVHESAKSLPCDYHSRSPQGTPTPRRARPAGARPWTSRCCSCSRVQGSFGSACAVRPPRETWPARCAGCWRTCSRSTAKWTPVREAHRLCSPRHGPVQSDRRRSGVVTTPVGDVWGIVI